MKYLGLMLLLLILIMLFINTGQNSMVDWSKINAVIIQSDDWGLCGFSPDSDSFEQIDISSLSPGNFPDVYWHSTLEDSLDIAVLGNMLLKHKDSTGLPAVFQANYITSSFDYSDNHWRVYDIPDLHPSYDRPGMWNAVSEAISKGVWCAELHGRWHYDPQKMQDSVSGNQCLESTFSNGTLLFPDCMKAYEFGVGRDDESLTIDLPASISVFKTLFDKNPQSIIAPDYVWTNRDEKLWKDNGIKAVQAKREQRWPQFNNYFGRAYKLFERNWKRITEKQLTYIERNCRLETVQHLDPNEVLEQCYQEVLRAWSKSEPAVIETHRINYVSHDPEMERIGLNVLDDLLHRVAKENPVWLTDHEYAQLSKYGASYRIIDSRVICRNFTHAVKPVVIPKVGTKESRIVYVPAGKTVIIN